jgi:hypothetical protein
MIDPGSIFSPAQSILIRTLILRFVQGIKLKMNKGYIIQALRNRVSMMLIAFLLLQPVVYSQLSVGINDQFECKSTEILVPVLVSDFNNVVSITLYIEVDTTGLHYEAMVNPDIALEGGTLLESFSDTNGKNVITVTWTRFTPVSIASGSLFDLKFYYKGGSPAMNFSNDCEIVLSDLSIVENVIYTDGKIETLEILSQPQHQTVVENNPVKFSITQQGATAYQWQQNSGNGWNDLTDTQGFSGSDTSELMINSVPLDFDQHLFRCFVSLNDCFETSDSAVLLVSPLGIASGEAGMSGISVYPNPCNDKLNFVINTSAKCTSVELVSLLGKTVIYLPAFELQNGNVQSIFTGDLQPGIYFLQFNRENGLSATIKVLIQ